LAAPGTWVLDLSWMLEQPEAIRAVTPLAIGTVVALVLSGYSSALREKLPPGTKLKALGVAERADSMSPLVRKPGAPASVQRSRPQ
jgi:hypothetical protein